jgi:predicted dehydrogenase
VTPASPFSIEIHGTRGSLLFGTPEPRLLVGTIANGERTWAERPVPDDGPTPFQQWVGHVQEGTVATENLALALDLTRLVDAANRAASSGTTIAMPA